MSILRDLDPRAARLEAVRRRSPGKFLPIGATLLVGGVALSWLFTTVSFDNDDTVSPPADAELLPDPSATAQGSAPPHPSGEPGLINAGETSPGTSPPPSPMQALTEGPAFILAPSAGTAGPQPAVRSTHQANPLKALTASAVAPKEAVAPEALPAKAKLAPMPAKPMGKSTEVAHGPKAGVATSAPSGKPAEKSAEPAASVKRVDVSKSASQRDVDIITAIVKDR